MNANDYMFTLSNGLDIWKALKKSGLEVVRTNGLPTYDDGLIEELRSTLYPNATLSFEKELASNIPSSEDFLDAFFQALKPFSQMLKEVLCMFEAANVKRSDENLKIEINFDKASSALCATLEEFREVESFFRKVSKPRIVRHWTSNTLFGLSRKVEDALKQIGIEQAWSASLSYLLLDEWVQNNGRSDWLEFPDFPKHNISELDQALQMSSQLIQYMQTEVMKLGSNYNEFTRAMGELPYEGKDDFETTKLEEGITKESSSPDRMFVQAAHDFWQNSFAKLLFLGVEKISKTTPTNRQGAAKILAEAVRQGFSEPPTHERTTEALIKDFRDIINLPIWKQRHELYAVWVSSQIFKVLSDYDWQWYPDGDCLRFPFGGIELATFLSENNYTNVFWTEKKTALIGKGVFGRKQIQPDYRITGLPSSNGDETSLVVECKQYRKWSRKNFSAALDDYAKGCPNAPIILVNYGPAPQSILADVHPSRRHQAHLIGDFKPGEKKPLEIFKNIIGKKYGEGKKYGKKYLTRSKGR